MFTCPACHTQYGDNYRVGEVCAECHEIGRIPKGAEKRERYSYSASVGHANAVMPLGRRRDTSDLIREAPKRARLPK